jgi:hypothetical protein
MRTQTARYGYVIALCDYCPNTTQFLGLQQIEELVRAQGWTVRRGKT